MTERDLYKTYTIIILFQWTNKNNKKIEKLVFWGSSSSVIFKQMKVQIRVWRVFSSTYEIFKHDQKNIIFFSIYFF